MNTRPTRIISLITAVVVFLLAAAAFVLSFDAIQQLAIQRGTPAHLAWLVPLVVDGAMIAFSMTILRASLHRERALWAYLLVGAFVLLSAALNAVNAVGDVWSVVIAVTAPVALFLSFESLMWQIRRSVERGAVLSDLDTLQAAVIEKQALLDTLTGKCRQLDDKISDKRREHADLNRRLKALKSDIKTGTAGSQSDTGPDIKSDIRPDIEPDSVTERRHQIPALLAEGMTQSDIARRFGVSPRTIGRDIKWLEIPEMEKQS